MAKLDEHPTVVRLRAQSRSVAVGHGSTPLDTEWLRRVCLEAGADDVGFVEVERAELARDRDAILAVFPHTRSLISFVCRMNREPIRSPARSVANLEFHHAGDRVSEVARAIVAGLEARGVRAMNPSMGFPMEMERFPGRVWVVSHKPVAVAAGLGLFYGGRAAELADRGRSLTPHDIAATMHRAFAEPGPVRSTLDLPFVLFDQPQRW